MKRMRAFAVLAWVMGTVALDAATVTVDAIANHTEPDSAVILRVGETALLPQPGAGAGYTLLNPRFVDFDSASGIVTAKEPGISGIDYVTGDTTNTLCVFVLEKETDPSHVFIFASTAQTSSWADPASWIGLDGKVSTEIPNAVDDIVYIAPTIEEDVTINLNADVKIGQVYIGRHKNLKKSTTLSIGTYCMTFERSDELPARLQACPNHLSGVWELVFRGNKDPADPNIVSKVDTVFDEGWGGEYTADNGHYCMNFKFSNAAVSISDGTQLALGGGSPRNYGSGATWSEIGWDGSNYLVGSGTLAHTGRGIMTLQFNCSNFSGSFIEAAGPHTGGYDRSRNFMLLAPTVWDSTLISAGYAARTDSDAISTSGSVGYYGAGVNHGAHYGDSKEVGNRLPWRGLTLRGGYGDFQPENPSPAWGADKVQSNHTARLTVDRGWNFLYVQGRSATEMDGRLQLNMFYAEALDTKTGGKGTLYVRETNSANGALDTYRSLVSFPSFTVGTGVFGKDVDCTESESYKMRPNVVARYSGWWDLCFAGVDAEGRLRRPVRNNVEVNGINDSTLNVYSQDKNLALTADATVGSLVLENRNKNKNLGAGRTLTIVSGGLVLGNEDSAIGAVGAGNDAGNLVFGDIAYVWSTAYRASNPNTISAKMTAPKGFVMAMSGYLQIVGDQTGIDDEIVVNGGTLCLGSVNGGDDVTIDVPVRIYAGAKVAVKTAGVLQRQTVYLDEVAGNAAKIEIDQGKTEKCDKLYYRDSVKNGNDEWVSVKRGTYGATGSGAQFIDDDRFSGQGILHVRSDDLLKGLKVIVR